MWTELAWRDYRKYFANHTRDHKGVHLYDAEDAGKNRIKADKQEKS